MSTKVVIATPLEAHLVDRISAAEPRVQVGYEPDLLPPTRYPSDHKGPPDFRRPGPLENRFWNLLAEAEVLFGVPGDTPAGLARVVRECPRLRWVAGTAAGAGELLRLASLSPAELDGILFTSAREVHTGQLAEWAIFGLLAFTKGLPRLLADKANRRWDHYPLRELAGQTLLVVGLGGIGRAVARRARSMGMRVVGVHRNADPSSTDPDVDEVRGTADLPDLVAGADAVVLSLPETDATQGLFSRALIDALPANAIVVNVGRGRTLDEQALIDALTEGRILGAALDVFHTEPLPADSPLWTMPDVLLSPHTAALSVHENERLVDLFIDNLHRYLDHHPLRNLVDPHRFY